MGERVGRPKGVSCLGLIKACVQITGSQSNLARRIGMTRAAVSGWLKGLTRPSKKAYRKLIKVVLAGKR